jgi:hypothetical protein
MKRSAQPFHAAHAKSGIPSRSTKRGTLNFGTAQLAQDVELVSVLDTLSGHCHTKVAREADHGPDNRQGPPISRQPHGKALVNLDPIDREAVQYAQ